MLSVPKGDGEDVLREDELAAIVVGADAGMPREVRTISMRRVRCSANRELNQLAQN